MAKQWVIALFIMLVAGAAVFSFQTFYQPDKSGPARQKQPRVRERCVPGFRYSQ